MRFWLLIALICILGVTEIFADISLMEWASKQRLSNVHWGLLVGIGIYALVGLLYGISLIYGKLSVANTLWQVFSIVIVFGIGVVAYNEAPTIGQWVGVLIILVGLGLIILSERDVWPANKHWPVLHTRWSPLPRGCEVSKPAVARTAGPPVS